MENLAILIILVVGIPYGAYQWYVLYVEPYLEKQERSS